MIRNLFLIGAVLAASSLAFGQTAQITGRIVDSSDAIVTGGRVVVLNTGTGIQRETASNEAGYYTVALLPKGSYQATVQKDGFRTIARSGIELDEGQALRLDFRLEVGQVTEAIEVHAASTLLDTTTTAMSTVVPNQRIEDLPMSGRNPVALAQLVPGVRMIGSMGTLPVSSYAAGPASIGGGSPGSNSYMIDGVANEYFTSGGMLAFLSVDATEEFRIITRNPSAEYGRTGGGVINLISKSGTNTFHGSVYEFLRNRDLNANSYFYNKAGTARSQQVFNEYGATVGGPIVRNRTFFFFNWEQFRNHFEARGFSTVPTVKQLSGDFSETLTSSGAPIKIYDPASTTGSSSTGYTRTVFPGNVIPSSQIGAAGLAMAKYYPSPNTRGATYTNANNYLGQAAAYQDKNAIGIKIDHNFTENRRLSGRYTHDSTNWEQGNLYRNIASPHYTLMRLPRNSVVLSYTDVLRPDFLLEARAGLNRYGGYRNTRSLGLDVSSLGLPASLNSQLQIQRFPSLSVTDMSSLGALSDDQLKQAEEAWTASLGFTKFLGVHTIKFGAEERVYRVNTFQSGGDFTFGFSRSFTQGPDPTKVSSTAGYGLATMLLGTATSGSVRRWSPVTNQQTYTAAFLQDDWKVTPNLTLNLGLRWEYEGPLTDRYNALTNFDPTVQTVTNGVTLRGGAIFPGTNGLPRGLWDKSFNDFGPRAGFAWQVLPKTSLRGGFGLFYIPFSYTAPATGFDITTSMVTSLDSVTPYNTLANPFPSGINMPTGSSLGALTALGSSLSATVRNQSGGYSEQWNLSLQRELPGNWLVEAGYMGNHGVKIQAGRSYRYLTAAQRALGSSVLLEMVDNPYYGIIKTGTLAAAKVQRQYLITQYPQFTGVSGSDSWGNSNYHAGTVRVEKRFSRGYSVLVAYTWSKLIDDTTGVAPATGGGSDGVQDWDNVRWARAVSTSNLPHRLVLNPSWRLPETKAGPRALRKIVNGWQLNTILTFQSGNPISVTASAPTGGGSWPNVIGDPNDVDDQSINKWFNTSAFTTISPWTMGNAPRNLPRTRTDSLYNWDFSTIKYIPIKERVTLEFRAEFFNFTNSVTFGTPGTSVGSSTFGIISSQANSPRAIQFGIKLKY
ncbi:MAG: TonB-dependent receptor [Bryobacteraceae bacterium]